MDHNWKKGRFLVSSCLANHRIVAAGPQRWHMSLDGGPEFYNQMNVGNVVGHKGAGSALRAIRRAASRDSPHPHRNRPGGQSDTRILVNLSHGVNGSGTGPGASVLFW